MTKKFFTVQYITKQIVFMLCQPRKQRPKWYLILQHHNQDFHSEMHTEGNYKTTFTIDVPISKWTGNFPCPSYKHTVQNLSLCTYKFAISHVTDRQTNNKWPRPPISDVKVCSPPYYCGHICFLITDTQGPGCGMSTTLFP